jgi:hypothetical protein
VGCLGVCAEGARGSGQRGCGANVWWDVDMLEGRLAACHIQTHTSKHVWVLKSQHFAPVDPRDEIAREVGRLGLLQADRFKQRLIRLVCVLLLVPSEPAALV